MTLFSIKDNKIKIKTVFNKSGFNKLVMIIYKDVTSRIGTDYISFLKICSAGTF